MSHNIPILRRVRSLTLVALLLAAATAWGSFPGIVSAQEVLTNDSVVGMVKAGLSEAVVIQKIRASTRRFDTSTDALVRLKRAGVPDKVIEAMVGEPAAAPATASAGSSADPTIAHLRGSSPTTLKSIIGSKEISAAPFVGSRQEVVLPTARAEYRMTDKEPVFTTPLPAQQWILAKLKPGKKDRNLPMSKNDGWGWGGATFRDGVDPKYAVKMVAEPGAGGLTKLKPEQPLSPGEYGFIAVTRGQPNMVEIFDFGVD